MSTFTEDMYNEKKKGTAFMIAGIAGLAAVIAGGCVAAYAISDTVKNQVKLAFSEPEDYFTWVCEKNTGDLAEICGASYQKAMDERATGRQLNGSLVYQPSGEAKDLLLSLTSLDDAQSPEETELADIIRNTDSIALTANASVRDDAIKDTVSFLRNDTTVITADGAFDLTQQFGFARLPELTETWAGFDLNAYLEEELDLDSVLQNADTMPNGQEVAEAIRKYGAMLVENVSDVTVTRSVPVEISSVTAEYTEISAPMTIGQWYDTAEHILTAASEDSTLRALYPFSDEYRESMIDDLNDLRSETENPDEIVELKIYVDPTGTIRGYDVAVGEDMTFFSAIGKQGDQLGAALRYSQGDTEYCNLRADATCIGGTYDGSAVITVSDYYYDEPKTVNVTFTDLELIGENHCYVTGNFSIQNDEIGTLAVSLTSDGNSQNVEYPIVIGGKDYGTLKLALANAPAEEFTLPERTDAFMIDMDYPEDDLPEYVDAETVARFCVDTLKKIGFSDSTAEEAGELITMNW